MAKRRDGKDTRRRLFDAASEVFARKGYKSANVAEICKFAGANVASVNYYFSGKESLYKEAYLNAVKRFTESFSIEVPYGSSHD